VRDRENDIWVWDALRGGLTRVTKDPNSDRAPVWTNDSRYILFGSLRDGTASVYRQRADGDGAAERISPTGFRGYPSSVSPDGTQLVLTEQPRDGFWDISVLPLEPRAPASGRSPSPAGATPSIPRTRPLVATSAAEFNAVLSPDGRWLAYQSNDSGEWNVYVRPFANASDGERATVSPDGGTQPRWSHDGRELFYLSRRNEMMSVQVGGGATWSAAPPQRLFDANAYFLAGLGNPFAMYDVAKDGRFLMIKPDTRSKSATSDDNHLVVVENWQEELKRLVPRK
jgi:eukaryotic-like serine/threonine-protein kinase